MLVSIFHSASDCYFACFHGISFQQCSRNKSGIYKSKLIGKKRNFAEYVYLFLFVTKEILPNLLHFPLKFSL